MQTCEAPDFWGLHKNKNCTFRLTKIIQLFSQISCRCLPSYCTKYENCVTNPVILNFLNNGGFTHQLGAHKNFTEIAMNQVIEYKTQ